MRQPALLRRCSTLVSSLALIALGSGGIRGAIAQTSPVCDPPAAGEYLLMVVHQTPEIQGRLQETLPRNATTTVCNYLGTEVTRVGGFTDITVANSWAQYLSDISGVQSFVARPAEISATESAAPSPEAPSAPSSTATVTVPPLSEAPSEASPTDGSSDGTSTSQAAADLVRPFPTPSSQTSATSGAVPSPQPAAQPQAAAPQPTSRASTSYNPRPLGTGYAVLVDYANRPEVAADVRQVTNTPVGLVAYEQRPYLLATYTAELSVAANILRNLSDRNFSAVIVDSRKAVLLAPAVTGE